jgi:UDP-glucose 4-epimerase
VRVLVLGGNGFIGSHLVDKLHAVGCRVRVFDRSTSQHKTAPVGIDYRMGLLSDSAQVAEALHDIDVVFHLISTSVPSTSNLDPIADINGNLLGTVQLLQQMVKLKIRRIVYLSSGGTVYGNPTLDPVSEAHPLNPVCSYGIVKVAIENYLFMFSHLYGLEAVVLRASNPYGPRQGHVGVQGVIPTFLQRVKDGDRIQIWGDGSIVRDYIFINDLVSLCAKAGLEDAVGVFNAGSGIGYSLNELLEIVTKITRKKVGVDYLPGRAFDVKRITLDISRTAKEFNWKPVVDIDAGIRESWLWLSTF